ncbi:MAG: hypothetical protein EA415_09895 [Sphaerobacteraceae bacterium]|nr:MAG: hypothetical protein EA415_09895 [Sphaerobacteraceae bacterium]
MTIAHAETAEQVGEYLASLLRGRGDVSKLYVLRSHELIELWLLIAPATIDAEVELHSLQRRLLERFPSNSLDLRILDVSRLGHGGVYAAVPRDAIQIEI